MDVPKLLAVSEGTSVALIAGTWYWVSRQGNVYANWRNKASFVALVLASVAVAVQFVLAIFTQFRSLDALDTASLQGGGNVVVAHLWLWSFFAQDCYRSPGSFSRYLEKEARDFPLGYGRA
ncbi:MAG: hypothetical protein DMG90_06390 [Acidobacteria bacterium]|nr:MAG: hypothetical protein DMG90_06390 [Acidobacteriota bacterium]